MSPNSSAGQSGGNVIGPPTGLETTSTPVERSLPRVTNTAICSPRLVQLERLESTMRPPARSCSITSSWRLADALSTAWYTASYGWRNDRLTPFPCSSFTDSTEAHPASTNAAHNARSHCFICHLLP